MVSFAEFPATSKVTARIVCVPSTSVVVSNAVPDNTVPSTYRTTRSTPLSASVAFTTISTLPETRVEFAGEVMTTTGETLSSIEIYRFEH